MLVKKEIQNSLLVSPSGNLYGSENVLFDFLEGSKKRYKIFAPANSPFYKRLKRSRYQVCGYKNTWLLYFRVLINLFFFKRNLLLNEAGHVRYVKILSSFFPKRKFIIIVRILEDCNSYLNQLNNNVELVAISNFISQNIQSNRGVHVIYDPFTLTNNERAWNRKHDSLIQIGILGRITKSKGLDHFFNLIETLNLHQREKFNFLFFGSVHANDDWAVEFKKKLRSYSNINYNFKGFMDNQFDLYNSFDMLLHLNENEPLGRIIFESVNAHMPFLCSNKGGTGELAKKLGLENYTYESVLEIGLQIEKILNQSEPLIKARKVIELEYSSEQYAIQIEKLF